MKADLRVDWATHEAAKYACEHWHYSRCVPHQKTVKVGVWEKSKYVGCVIFGDGANPGLLSPYGLRSDQGCELVRIALTKHESSVSRIVRLAIMFLRKRCSGVRLVISFADPEQGHHGGVYQAGGWVYLGKTDPADEYIVKGKRVHGRALNSTRSTHKNRNAAAKNIEEWAKKFIDPGIVKVKGSSKHRYAMPLDEDMRAAIMPLSKPYPKRVRSSETSGYPPEERQGSTDPDAPNA